MLLQYNRAINFIKMAIKRSTNHAETTGAMAALEILLSINAKAHRHDINKPTHVVFMSAADYTNYLNFLKTPQTIKDYDNTTDFFKSRRPYGIKRMPGKRRQPRNAICQGST